MTIKQHGGVFGRNPSFNDVSVETLSIAGTALSSTALELNILDGVTADATEINYLDGASTSVVTASKAVIANSSANIAFASGNGIDFSATSGTGTSELFADYEEGTWTATFGDAAGGTYTGAYDFNNGRYTKIGRIVFFSFRIRATNDLPTTGLTGAQEIRINGLPFTKTANTPQANGAAELYADLPAGATQSTFFIRESVDYVSLRASGDDFSQVNLTVTMINDGSFKQAVVNGFYEV
jgi:hypothetical protein